MNIAVLVVFALYVTVCVSQSFVRDEVPIGEKTSKHRLEQNTLASKPIFKKKYEPTWESLDSRPLPEWYDQAKFGIFIHWGVFSVPSFVSEWFWWYWKETRQKNVVDFMEKNYPPHFTYADFAKDFTAELYDPDQWADLFKESGAQYVVLTSKHHEGYTNWPSNVSWNWNSMDVGPHRDLVGELANSIRNRTYLKFGLYHSLFEWFNPLYLADKASNFTTRRYATEKSIQELYELVNTYKPDIVWSDGDPGPVEYWNSTGFLAWLYNDSPVKDMVVTNDRWGAGCMCKHGGYFTCQDRYSPGVLQHHKWENCMTIDRYSWGYRRNANIQDFLTIEEIISTFASTISCGGNMLMNVGPTKDGMIAPVFQDRLREFGSWLKVNGEAVYSSKPWRSQNDSVTPNIWYTEKPGTVYTFVLSWPKSNWIELGEPVPGNSTNEISLLGHKGLLEWYIRNSLLHIRMPNLNTSDLPCKWAWVLRLSGFV
uniref:alpha-L-fucosidase n=1 Tax=Ciona intestinalis TaxID=7719 RepID=UPI000180CF6D|nr:alpha-L-fucosidase [Ciona intestinalis]|eukprot:XP_002131484.1 alpha-L-fucosidase [Ciona intestinalis]